MGGDNEGGRSKGLQGKCVKDNGQSQKGVGLRVGGRDGWDGWEWLWGNMETTVLEQQ